MKIKIINVNFKLELVHEYWPYSDFEASQEIEGKDCSMVARLTFVHDENKAYMGFHTENEGDHRESPIQITMTWEEAEEIIGREMKRVPNNEETANMV